MKDNTRQVSFWTPDLHVETRADGTMLLSQTAPLGPWPRCLSERFAHWADTTPDQPWIAEKDGQGSWTRLPYGAAYQQIRGIGQWLRAHGLTEDTPVLILSGNSIAHALMALGAQHVGVPSAALAPAYALSGGGYLKLRDIAEQLTPGVIFADSAAPFAEAIQTVFPDTPVVSLSGEVAGHETTSFDVLTSTAPGPEEAQAAANVTGHTVAKYLFTSGTTGSPKAVIQTQDMLCSNQQMVQQCFTFMTETPPVVVDWAPWNHTAAGNKVFNMVIWNGGTYYIDDGRPTPKAIGKTIDTLREIAPTWYFNVPLGYQMLLDAFETDHTLRETFFSRLQMMFYAGAGMGQHVWDRITRVAAEMVPGGVLLTTGFGATETGPFCLINTDRQEVAGNLGLPAHGVTLKLVPQDDKLELRAKSPSITPGYHGNPTLTAEAFDDEGFYSFGDAVRFADPNDPSKGLLFDGRLAENFKLASGTWVATGPLRATLTNALGGLASDVVIAGEGHTELGALLVPNHAALVEITGEEMDGEALLSHPAVRDETTRRLSEAARAATGSASRVMRAMFMSVPLDFDKGEVTDKGSINQRAVLRHRVDLVDALWSEDPRIIKAVS